MQEAEFSFQKSEYEAEIQSLKQREEILQRNLASQNQLKHSQQYDVNVTVDADKNSEIIKKYEKWKKKAKELEINNDISIEELLPLCITFFSLNKYKRILMFLPKILNISSFDMILMISSRISLMILSIFVKNLVLR